MGKFTAQIDAWVQESDKRLTRVIQASTMQVADEANVPTAKGGRMHVDTGFLRASGQFSFSGLPSGPARPEEAKTYPSADAPNLSEPVVLTVLKMKPGDTIFFGWTANYAKYREHFDGFLRLAVQRWPDIVKQNIAKAKARVASK